MPKKISVQTPAQAFGKVPVVLHMDAHLVRRIDVLAAKSHVSRSALIAILSSISLGMVERLLDPAKWLSDPLLTSILEKQMNDRGAGAPQDSDK